MSTPAKQTDPSTQNKQKVDGHNHTAEKQHKHDTCVSLRDQSLCVPLSQPSQFSVVSQDTSWPLPNLPDNPVYSYTAQQSMRSLIPQ